ncbi:MAG: maleylpyruvate isomerase family mycothiol-dependent enzyme [Acidimicrobiales bacterium]
MTDQLEVLRTSVVRLRGIVEGLDPGQLAAPAYPTEWTIADVLSHLGSGAVIFQRWFDDALAGRETPSSFAEPVWAEWKAKSAQAKAADFLAADEVFLERLWSLADDDRARFKFAMGPMTFDFAGFVGLRLNEHALHTWDIEVALDPGAAVAPGSAGLVVDNLQMMVRFTGKPTGTEHTVAVRTSEPRRDFVIVIGADAVLLEPAEPVDEPDLLIPAEAFIRLVYGRLDPGHAPATRGPADLRELRRVFPGA